MLHKIYSISSYLWAISCYAFAGIILAMTKFMTHDPNLSGGAETVYLIPMLSIIAVGTASFGTAILTWIIAKFKKIKLAVKHFWISFALVALLGAMGLTFLIGFRNANAGYKKADFTGQQLFDQVNVYRKEHGKPEFVLDPVICDNLVSRYLQITSADVGHQGFDEWAKQEGIDKKYTMGAELYIKDSATPADAVAWWDGSPGHRLSLLGEYTNGCAYAMDGTGVVVVGVPVKK